VNRPTIQRATPFSLAALGACGGGGRDTSVASSTTGTSSSTTPLAAGCKQSGMALVVLPYSVGAGNPPVPFNTCPSKAATTTATTGGGIGLMISGPALFNQRHHECHTGAPERRVPLRAAGGGDELPVTAALLLGHRAGQADRGVAGGRRLLGTGGSDCPGFGARGTGPLRPPVRRAAGRRAQLLFAAGLAARGGGTADSSSAVTSTVPATPTSPTTATSRSFKAQVWADNGLGA
jgi:hypothetical protein